MVIFPILFPITSVNQTLAVRAGPAVMPSGLLRPVGIGNSLITTPAVVIRPILPTPKNSVNQRLPSGPFVMPKGLLPDVGTANSVMTPLVVIRDAKRAASGRGDGELLDAAHFGPRGGTAQAQQADTGNTGCYECGQTRPQTRTLHDLFSLCN